MDLVKRQDLEDLLAEIMHATEWLRDVARHTPIDTELAREVSDYRRSVEQLQQMLPAMHARLVKEKARLEAARTHLAAAAAWAQASTRSL
jgi:hypothetical protein